MNCSTYKKSDCETKKNCMWSDSTNKCIRKYQAPKNFRYFARKLPTDLLKHKVKPFLGNKTCDDLTQLGRNCNLPKVFENKSTEQEIDCTWYCLAKCTPEKLLPIFDPPKWVIVEQKGQEHKLDIDQSSLNIRILDNETSDYLVSIYKNKSNPLLWGYYLADEVLNIAEQHEEKLTTNEISRLLCRIFRKISLIPINWITFEISVKFHLNLKNGNVKTFSKPYIRPLNHWLIDWANKGNSIRGIHTSFDIDLSNIN